MRTLSQAKQYCQLDACGWSLPTSSWASKKSSSWNPILSCVEESTLNAEILLLFFHFWSPKLDFEWDLSLSWEFGCAMKIFVLLGIVQKAWIRRPWANETQFVVELFMKNVCSIVKYSPLYSFGPIHVHIELNRYFIVFSKEKKRRKNIFLLFSSLIDPFLYYLNCYCAETLKI